MPVNVALRVPGMRFCPETRCTASAWIWLQRDDLATRQRRHGGVAIAEKPLAEVAS